jgi:GNAT superfamily N-acetyltransferase
MSNPHLRSATIDDAANMARVESQSWSRELASSKDQIRDRIHTFPAGQWVAEPGGQIVGIVFAQRISQLFLDQTPRQYNLLTDEGRFVSTHRSDGEIYQLVGVGVLPTSRGARLGRQLVDRQVEFARSLPGVDRIIGFTRPSGYHRHSDSPIDDYVQLRRADGRLVDPTLAFHSEGGAEIISTHADYRCEDLQSCGYGVLIEYAKQEL